jgi:hypothetical protein
MADINPCDDARRATVKRLAEKYPALKWRVQLSIPSNLDAAFPDADRREFFLLDHDEALWSLPAAPDAPAPEPPPAKRIQLKLAFEMSVRAGPGTTYATLGKLAQGTVASFVADERPVSNILQNGVMVPCYWRRLADGFEGRAVAWIAEAVTDGSKVFLTDPQ